MKTHHQLEGICVLKPYLITATLLLRLQNCTLNITCPGNFRQRIERKIYENLRILSVSFLVANDVQVT